MPPFLRKGRHLFETDLLEPSTRPTMERASSARPLYIVHAGTAFEDTEAVDEMYHKVTAQRVVFRILRIAGGYAAGDIAALFQDIVYLETKRCLLPFQE